ncbi:MAG: DinB family protein [Bacteroidota bacterium]
MKISDHSGPMRDLLQIIDESYGRPAWHGTNLRGSIKGLTVEKAAWRPAAVRHNIWEIVVHCAYWKHIVRQRLLGEKMRTFPLKGRNWFKRPVEATEKEWRADILLLEQTHRSLREAIAGLKPSDLKRNLSGKKWTILQTVSGIASHDVYHAGQIQLLKRLQKEIS